MAGVIKAALAFGDHTAARNLVNVFEDLMNEWKAQMKETNGPLYEGFSNSFNPVTGTDQDIRDYLPEMLLRNASGFGSFQALTLV